MSASQLLVGAAVLVLVAVISVTAYLVRRGNRVMTALIAEQREAAERSGLKGYTPQTVDRYQDEVDRRFRWEQL